MKEFHLWDFIHHNLLKNNAVILIAVVNHETGSPGKEGFKMAVSSNGDFTGSIGGGVMEYNALRECKCFFKNKTSVRKVEKLYHNRKSTSNISGLICAGSQTNFTISFEKRDLKLIENILEFIKLYKPGKIQFSSDGIKILRVKKNDSVYFYNFIKDSNWKYEEIIGLKNYVYIIGGGHVGLAVSKVMSMLDFFVTIYDDRKNLLMLKQSTFANKIITGSFKKTGSKIKEGNQTYIVIVTKSYISDKESLISVLNKNVRYIGIMGTKVKIKKIFNDVVKEGIKKEQLKKVNAPIGIDINSDTPEEIAVSIAAEIIRIKNS